MYFSKLSGMFGAPSKRMGTNASCVIEPEEPSNFAQESSLLTSPEMMESAAARLRVSGASSAERPVKPP